MIVFGPTDFTDGHRFLTCSVWDEGVSLFIGLRRINGTLTAFLGLLTDFKRKLDLAVVAIPPKTGTLRRSPMAARPNPFKFRA